MKKTKEEKFPQVVYVTIGGWDGMQLNAESTELAAVAHEEGIPGRLVSVAVYTLDHVKTSRRTTTEAVPR